MGYELTSAQKAPVLDLDGNPILTADIHGDGGAEPPFAVGASATMQDDGTGNLIVVGNAPGTTTFDLISNATSALASHDVTVTAAPFDWTLGAPVAK